MSAQYSNELKKKLAELICIDGESTIQTADAYNVPLKTLEKWITAFRKNPSCFDTIKSSNDFKIANFKVKDDIYDDMSNEELKRLLIKKDIEIVRLKKNYQVIQDGTGKKVFITFSKKNTK